MFKITSDVKDFFTQPLNVNKPLPENRIAKIFLEFGQFADNALHFGKKEFSLEKKTFTLVDNWAKKTLAKVAIFVLTFFILPAILLPAKYHYRKWVNEPVILAPTSFSNADNQTDTSSLSQPKEASKSTSKAELQRKLSVRFERRLTISDLQKAVDQIPTQVLTELFTAENEKTLDDLDKEERALEILEQMESQNLPDEEIYRLLLELESLSKENMSLNTVGKQKAHRMLFGKKQVSFRLAKHTKQEGDIFAKTKKYKPIQADLIELPAFIQAMKDKIRLRNQRNVAKLLNVTNSEAHKATLKKFMFDAISDRRKAIEPKLLSKTESGHFVHIYRLAPVAADEEGQKEAGFIILTETDLEKEPVPNKLADDAYWEVAPPADSEEETSYDSSSIVVGKPSNVHSFSSDSMVVTANTSSELDHIKMNIS